MPQELLRPDEQRLEIASQFGGGRFVPIDPGLVAGSGIFRSRMLTFYILGCRLSTCGVETATRTGSSSCRGPWI